MRINWFSPLPPAPTDIANYSARVLPALARRAEVTLWSDQPEWAPELDRWAVVRRFDANDPPWQEINQADVTLYHIGNDRRFHGGIWRIGRSMPGVVVLHDCCLHEFFLGVAREDLNCRESYLTQMESCYGPAGRSDGIDIWEGRRPVGEVVTRYPLTPAASNHALGAVVHTRLAFEALQRSNPAPTVLAELPYPASQLDTARLREDRRNGAGSGSPLYKLIVFGFLGRNRCLEQLLEALASFPRRDRFRLEIYGQLYDPAAIQNRINALRLTDMVRVHGFVAEAQLNDALASSHMAINLRFPTMGEASGSQLRIWDHALPSLVTRHGWYASLPADSVGFVRPGYELADVHEHLDRFLKDPQAYKRMGAAGRLRLQAHHSPEAYAEALVGFASESAERRRHRAARLLARRVGTHMGVWAPPCLAEAPYRRVAQRIHSMLAPDARPQ